MIDNLFSELPATAKTEEQFLTLLSLPGLQIERIVSYGQTSPSGFWYEQEQTEWVVVLTGTACLRFEDEAEARRLEQGDFVLIAPRRRHRVEWTDPTQNTVWLAIHYEPAAQQKCT